MIYLTVACFDKGYSRDGKKKKRQIEFGLLCDKQGRPVSVEVFEGNTFDSATVASQIEKVKKRFKLSKVIIVGDRGMLTQDLIKEDLKTAQELSWISALRGPAIKELIAQGDIQPELFDDIQMAEIKSDDYPKERLVVCKNPFLEEKRQKTRMRLLAKTQEALQKIQEATQRPNRPLIGADKIGARVGEVFEKYKVGKHFDIHITDKSFSFTQNLDNIAREAQLDGFYVIRSNVASKEMTSGQLVENYKRLTQVERAFRTIKTVDLKVRPVHHYLEDRVRSHIFLCMLSYYVEWHMKEALQSMLFDDEDKKMAQAQRTSPVSSALVSKTAKHKATNKTDLDGNPVHSFHTLLADLATITRNTISPMGKRDSTFIKTTTSTKLQARALNLLKVAL